LFGNFPRQSRDGRGKPQRLAEGMGFEPTIGVFPL
jgi:hypothetical protein